MASRWNFLYECLLPWVNQHFLPLTSFVGDIFATSDGCYPISLLLPHDPPGSHQPTFPADVPFASLSRSKVLMNLLSSSWGKKKNQPIKTPFNWVLSLLTDLENFKTRTRSTVSVRQGQGMVLLCGPPPHSGGTALSFSCLQRSAVICKVFLLRVCLGKFLVVHLKEEGCWW